MRGLPWIRVDTDLPDHPKSDELASLLNDARAWTYPLQLWLWAARVCQDGDLSKLDDASIARRSGWKGKPDVFVAALVKVGFLDGDRRLHDWTEYQTLVADRLRKDRARKASKAGQAANDAQATAGNFADVPRTFRGHCAAVPAQSAGPSEEVPKPQVRNGCADETRRDETLDSVPKGTGRAAAPASAQATEGQPEPPTDSHKHLALTPPGPPPEELARRERERGYRLAAERLLKRWQAARSDPHARLTKAAKAGVRNALIAGRTEQDLERSIDAHCRGSSFMRRRSLEQCVSEAGIQEAHGARLADNLHPTTEHVVGDGWNP